MHIAYSAKRNIKKIPVNHNCNLSDRYCGYLAACRKHRQTIAAIQEYLPGWEPPSPGAHPTRFKEGL